MRYQMESPVDKNVLRRFPADPQSIPSRSWRTTAHRVPILPDNTAEYHLVPVSTTQYSQYTKSEVSQVLPYCNHDCSRELG